MLTTIILFISSLAIVYYATPFLPQINYGKTLPFINQIYPTESERLTTESSANSVLSLILPEDSAIVETNHGKLLGFTIREQNALVKVFLGVPYAAPPVGDLRFMRPVSPPSWKGLRPAVRFNKQCIQFKPNSTFTPWISDVDNMAEDCLYLNIWSPVTNETLSTNRKSVMVWFHGGAFFSGSTDVDYYDGRTLAALGDVIVVTVNYRLGSLGFLDLKVSPDVTGNQGLYDQLQALTWVKDNIGFFGGDPEEVTIFGQSAGAISVGLHYLSPLSDPYFKRAILESGSPMVSRLFYERETEATDKVPEFSRQLGCLGDNDRISEDNSDAILSCLQRADIADIMVIQDNIISETNLAFGPTSGDDFLPDLPVNILHEGMGSVSGKEVMIGINRDEGSFFLHFINPEIFGNIPRNISHQEGMAIAKESLSLLSPEFAQFVLDMFLAGSQDQDPETVRTALTSFIGDSSFVCPATLMAGLLDKNGRQVYFYQYDHQLAHSTWPTWMGAAHFDEVPFVLGHPVRHVGQYQADEVSLSRSMMAAWVTFAKTGAPGKVEGKEWPLYKKAEPKVMHFDTSNLYIGQSNPRHSSCARWHLLLENS
ncbi:Cholinesterase [Halotydeus destructor]|nr:Cholinesterase [Halotydeus destructor]